MTPTRLRECLEALGWSQRGLADKLGVHETRARRWARGTLEVPPEVAEWLDKLARTHEAYPMPIGWPRQQGEARSPSITVRVFGSDGIDRSAEMVECHDATDAMDAVVERNGRLKGSGKTVVVSTKGRCSDADLAELERQGAAEGYHLDQIG